MCLVHFSFLCTFLLIMVTTSRRIDMTCGPECLIQTKPLLYQQCINNGENLPSKCANSKMVTLPHCPEDFIDANNICYQITPPTTFPPVCPYENLLPFNSYKSVITIEGSPIWMPVRRDVSNGLGFLEWIEASTLYRTEVTADIFIPSRIKGNDCLVYYNSTYIILVSCDEKFSGVCAYKKLNEVVNRICNSLGSCHQKDFSAGSDCLCVGGSDKNQTEFKKAEFLEPYQNKVYESLSSDDCTIGLERISNGSYIWTNSIQEPNYAFWRADTIFDISHIYGALTTTGWIMTETPLTCFLYDMNVEISQPILRLIFENEERFRLTITNPKSLLWWSEMFPLVFCFSNAGSLSLTYRYELLTKVEENEDTLIYEFEPHKNGPGHYWCEAFTLSDSEPIKTERVFVNESRRYGDDFVAILNTRYIPGSNPLSVGLIDLLERIFFIKLKLETTEDSHCSYSSRLMEIMDIDEDKFVATVIVHFTCLISQKNTVSLPISFSSDEEFERMKNLINRTILDLQDMSIEMIDFRSASYCPEHFEEIVWPRTEIGYFAAPSDFCFTQDGLRSRRLCNGSFIDGAQWLTIEDCRKPNNSDVTQLLLEIGQNSEPLNDLHNIVASRYTEFQSFDVYLVAQLLNVHLDNINTEEFGQIWDTIFLIEADILIRAQQQMRAMDIFLQTIDKAPALRNFNSQNLVIISGNNYTGIVMMQDRSVKFLTGEFNLSEILDTYPGLEGAVFVTTRTTFAGIENYIFKVFYDNFFTKITDMTQSVFGVVLGDSSVVSIQLVFRKSFNSAKGNCVYWSYDLNNADGRGLWKFANTTKDHGLFLICDYDNVDVSAVTLFLSTQVDQNVTENLQTLLNSDESPDYILNELSAISDRYDEFTPDDVYLVGQILYKIRNSTNLDLSVLAHVISNMHEVRRIILSKSQKQTIATDLILFALDSIIKNHDFATTVNVTESNFMIYIADVKETDFTGLVVYDNTDLIETRNLTGAIDLSDIFAVQNLNSALYLPAELKQELMEDTIISVAIFVNDGLFNGNDTFKFVTRIFGVMLDVEEFLHPLSFIYKVTNESYDRSCVYWLYDKPNNRTGLWKQEDEENKFNMFSECQFWHTTHFALLLVDTDRYDSPVLDWITNINYALSMFGLCVIILTAICFKRWRSNSGNQILLNYVFISIIQIGVFYTSGLLNKDSDDHVLCTIFGIILHYTIISQFCWMFVIAVLQFKRFVEVLKAPPKHILLKACLCGWGLPFLPVACVYFLDNDNYVKGNGDLCYPSDLGLYLGVWLPIGIVVVINIVIFIYILYNVIHKKTECHDVGNNEVMFQFRLAVLLFFMLGTTWTFGFLSELDFGIVFVYVFTVTATLQGFVMFLFFILFNANTRYLYVHACNKNNKNY